MCGKKWNLILNNLKSEHNALDNLVSGKKVAFLDMPCYFNVGDLLIYLGTESYFSNKAVNVIYRSDYKNISHRKLREADVIIFQGGGNFGDLYPLLQSMREKVVKKYHDKIIICLPQTIFFKNEQELKKSSLLFREHKNFHFYTRDSSSYELAASFTDKRYLMPDMAHSLHPLKEVNEIRIEKIFPKILNLVRVDDECPSVKSQLLKRAFDWKDIISNEDKLSLLLYSFLVKIDQAKANRFWYNTCNQILFKSVNYFDQHDIVYTDRLHGLILAVLLGKEIKLYDNSYGKNSGYYNQWLSGMENISCKFDE